LRRRVEDEGAGAVVEDAATVGEDGAVFGGDLVVFGALVGLGAGVHSADESGFAQALEVTAHEVGVAVELFGKSGDTTPVTVRQFLEHGIAGGFGDGAEDFERGTPFSWSGRGAAGGIRCFDLTHGSKVRFSRHETRENKAWRVIAEAWSLVSAALRFNARALIWVIVPPAHRWQSLKSGIETSEEAIADC